MSEEKRIRVFSVDDHPLLREGIAAIIEDFQLRPSRLKPAKT